MYEELIALFLKHNPEPSDEQVHSLAHALGCDKETLEAEMYKMLAEDEDLLIDPDEVDATSIYADSQDVLEDVDADPDAMPLQDVALNDGDPTNDDLGLQEETTDDGLDMLDRGTGLVNNVSDVLTDDGIPDLALD